MYRVEHSNAKDSKYVAFGNHFQGQKGKRTA